MAPPSAESSEGDCASGTFWDRQRQYLALRDQRLTDLLRPLSIRSLSLLHGSRTREGSEAQGPEAQGPCGTIHSRTFFFTLVDESKEEEEKKFRAEHHLAFVWGRPPVMEGGAWFMIQGSGCEVQGARFRCRGFPVHKWSAGQTEVMCPWRSRPRTHPQDFGIEARSPPSTVRIKVQGSGFRVQGAGCRVQSAGFRVQGSGFRVQGSGFRV